MKCGRWSARVTTGPLGSIRTLAMDQPSQAFWAVWKRERDLLKAFGVSVHKDPHWRAAWLQPADAAPPPPPPEAPPADESGVPAELRDKLKPWQPRAVALGSQGIRAHGAFLDGSECGVGKTYSTIATAITLGLRPVVIAPLQTLPGWRRAFAHFGVKGEATNYEQAKFGHRPDIVRVMEGKKPSFQWQLGRGDLLVFDEAQVISGWVPGRPPPLVARMGASAAWQGIQAMLLSATLADKLVKLQCAGRFLNLYPDTKGGFEDWIAGLGAIKTGYGWWLPDDQQENLGEVHRAIYGAGKGIRLRKRDLPDFPDIEVGVQMMELESKDRVRLMELHREQRSAVEAMLRGGFSSEGTEHVMTIRRKIEMLKVPALAELAKSYMDEGCSVPIFVNFRDTVTALCCELHTDCHLIGGMDPELRERNRARFHADDERAIVGTLGAADLGIDLDDIHGKYPRVALINPGLRTDQIVQANGRHHRANSKSKAMTRLCWVAGTEEEAVAERAERKLGDLSMLNDGELDACPMAAAMKGVA